jgi:hypothetical protein
MLALMNAGGMAGERKLHVANPQAITVPYGIALGGGTLIALFCMYFL